MSDQPRYRNAYFEIESTNETNESFFSKYKYFIIAGVVLLIALTGFLLWFFLRKKEEPPVYKPDPKINLYGVIASNDIDYYRDSRTKREYNKLYTLVKNILGNNTPKECYNLNNIKLLSPDSINKERNIDIIIRPAVQNALERNNYYDIAALYLQLMRTYNSESDYDNLFSVVEKESNGVTPKKVKLKDGVSPSQLLSTYTIPDTEPLKSLLLKLKANGNFNNNIITVDDLSILLTILMILRLNITKNFIGYPPCDV